jgi:hypothetical protein
VIRLNEPRVFKLIAISCLGMSALGPFWYFPHRFALVQQDKNAQSIHRYNRTNKHKVGVATRTERLCHDFGEESDKLSVFFPGELSLDFYFFQTMAKGKRFASVQQDKNAQSRCGH